MFAIVHQRLRRQEGFKHHDGSGRLRYFRSMGFEKEVLNQFEEEFSMSSRAIATMMGASYFEKSES